VKPATDLEDRGGKSDGPGRRQSRDRNRRRIEDRRDAPIRSKILASAGRNVPIDPSEMAKAGVPLVKAGQAQDIANGVRFLASDASTYMTGAELVIDGGMTGGARPRWS
jgi:NAD(P)-dependent dehydrogenase (short-subunit alcohol dehydrogenase family)